MSSTQPQGEKLKKAIKWMSDVRKEKPGIDPAKLADEASFRFDLSPKDSQFLLRLIQNGNH